MNYNVRPIVRAITASAYSLKFESFSIGDVCMAHSKLHQVKIKFVKYLLATLTMLPVYHVTCTTNETQSPSSFVEIN